MVGDEVAGLDRQVLDEQGAHAGHGRAPRGEVEGEHPFLPPRHRVDQVQARDGVVVVGPHFDGDLLERGDLAVAAGPQHPHRGGAVGHRPDHVAGRTAVRQPVRVDHAHRVPAVALDRQRPRAAAVPGVGQGHPPAAGQHQRAFRHRLVGMHHQPRNGTGGSEQVAAVLLDPRGKSGEGGIRVLDVDPRHPRRRQRLDEIVAAGEPGRADPVAEAAGDRGELREPAAAAGRPHAHVARRPAVEHRQHRRSAAPEAVPAAGPHADAEGLPGHETEIAGVDHEMGRGRRRAQPGGGREAAERRGPQGGHRGEQGQSRQSPPGRPPHPGRGDDAGEVDAAEAFGGVGEQQLMEARGRPRPRERNGAGHPVFQLGATFFDEPRHPLVRGRPAQRPHHARGEGEGREGHGPGHRQQGRVRRREERLGGDDHQQADAGAPHHADDSAQPADRQPAAPDPVQGGPQRRPVPVTHGAHCLTRPGDRQTGRGTRPGRAPWRRPVAAVRREASRSRHQSFPINWLTDSPTSRAIWRSNTGETSRPP